MRDVSFEVQQGEVFALLGPERRRQDHDASRSSRASATAAAGGCETLGVDPADHSTQRWLRTRIGVVLQELAVEPYYSVRQVLTRNAGYYPNPRPVDEVIELIGLAEKADDRIKRLSGGQQRRLDVGLGIIGNPELLFLDEPTTGLDPSGRRDTWELIRRLAAAGTTVLLTTHYMDEVEALADRVAVLFGQEIVAGGHAVVDRRPRPGRGDDPLPPARRVWPPSDLPVAGDEPSTTARSRSAPRTRSACCTTLTGLGARGRPRAARGCRCCGSRSRTSTWA